MFALIKYIIYSITLDPLKSLQELLLEFFQR